MAEIKISEKEGDLFLRGIAVGALFGFVGSYLVTATYRFEDYFFEPSFAIDVFRFVAALIAFVSIIGWFYFKLRKNKVKIR